MNSLVYSSPEGGASIPGELVARLEAGLAGALDAAWVPGLGRCSYADLRTLLAAYKSQAKRQADEGVVVLQTARGPIDVDTSIAPIVAALNAAGVETIASCSGHGHRPGNIALRDGRELIIARDYAEGRLIDSLFPVSASGEIVAPERKNSAACSDCKGTGSRLCRPIPHGERVQRDLCSTCGGTGRLAPCAAILKARRGAGA